MTTDRLEASPQGPRDRHPYNKATAREDRHSPDDRRVRADHRRRRQHAAADAAASSLSSALTISSSAEIQRLAATASRASATRC